MAVSAGAQLLLQVWENTRAFAEAYRLGRAESKAATNLLLHVPQKTVENLARFVRTDFVWLPSSSELLLLACQDFWDEPLHAP